MRLEICLPKRLEPRLVIPWQCKTEPSRYGFFIKHTHTRTRCNKFQVKQDFFSHVPVCVCWHRTPTPHGVCWSWKPLLIVAFCVPTADRACSSFCVSKRCILDAYYYLQCSAEVTFRAYRIGGLERLCKRGRLLANPTERQRARC